MRFFRPKFIDIFLCCTFSLRNKKFVFWVFLLSGTFYKYRFYPKYWDGQGCANSLDPDQMQQNAASDQGLLFLTILYIHQFLDT